MPNLIEQISMHNYLLQRHKGSMFYEIFTWLQANIHELHYNTKSNHIKSKHNKASDKP
jgi:hypothetical protein